jgi:serine/threonine protein kinase
MLRPTMPEGADPALIGRRVAGKFVVEQFLGGGAMGAVYRARDDSLDRKVALKVMHPAVAIDPSFVSRFHREAKAASRLDHPNSMRVIEFGEEPDGLLFIAMEYLEGRELYKVIHEDWPLSDARIADIMMKALAAIAVGHDMGVIHRDLKPENIMILTRKDDEGQDMVKVCDFGIAKITEPDDTAPDGAPKTAGVKLTTAGVVVGTPEYMSPEQARGEKLDSRSDLYSMGIILYQLLTGRTPFLADTALAVVLKHITEPPEPPHVIYPEVHRGLEAVALRALAKSKNERFQTARDMRAALKAAIEGRPIPQDSGEARPNAGASGAPPPPSDAPRRGASERPAVSTTEAPKRSKAPLAIALIAIALGGAAFLLYAQRENLLPMLPLPSSTEAPPSSAH